MKPTRPLQPVARMLLPLLCCLAVLAGPAVSAGGLAEEFASPPDSARPWVYLMVMDGNLTAEGLTADLEAMKQAGIGGVIFMEVNVGIPRGKVDFMSPAWQGLIVHAVRQAERLGLQITMNSGPGWTGSGGPWVTPEQSMQHLVASSTQVKGPGRFEAVLAQPAPRPPYFGSHLPPALEKARKEWYRDVAVLAFPTPKTAARTPNIDEKALYIREPYSSKAGVPPRLPSPADAPGVAADACIPLAGVVDLTAQMDASGKLAWDAPAGDWTVLRLGRTSTGANTRPAPAPGLGLECNKMDPAALDAHFEQFIGRLLKTLGPRQTDGQAGWTHLHIDSWEMGAQNWTADFRQQFRTRRGYDPLPYLPAYTGLIVASPEITERFLWDVRLTSQELVVENHARRLKELGRRHGFGLSIEPYDMNPCADMALGAVADVPMCEFWANTFETSFSVMEAASIAATRGRPIVAAEAFTSAGDGWQRHPRTIKQQTDWAFCQGVNRIVFHRYQHQPLVDRRPGMTFGPYGVHWERTQTWWPLAGAFHAYLARCQHMLRQGQPAGDILYLTPEGAPCVFTPPPSALTGPDRLRDQRGYSFHACDSDALLELATVKDGRIAFPSGASYGILVLPHSPTMTPRLLRKVVDLLEAGAAVQGSLPVKSPSLSNYPACDKEVAALSAFQLVPGGPDGLRVGKGRFYPAGQPRLAAPQTDLTRAKWIWHARGDWSRAAAGEKRLFRRTIQVPAGPALAATIAVTADNAFTLRLNGQAVGEGDNFTKLYRFDLPLKPGDNLVEVEASNVGETPNPAGLIACLTLAHADGKTAEIVTDAQWQSAETPAGPWNAARELGPVSMAPWNLPARPAAPAPDLYPDYASTARLLAARGLQSDLQSAQPIRYIHRRDGQRDIYFVSNPADAPLAGAVRFRAGGKSAILLDPMTGRAYRPAAEPRCDAQSGLTELDLALPPAGSVFVVFEPAPADPKLPPFPAPADKVIATLEGPWEVAFPAGCGAPARIDLPALSDLSRHADGGVRHFSGLATYRKRFTCKSPAGSTMPTVLDLGQVEVMARVRLNGKDLGIVWKTPYQVGLADALKEGENELEIDVANLWINRLAGDAALPPDQRTTWTTWNPYKPNSPLPASGLVGPVTLR